LAGAVYRYELILGSYALRPRAPVAAAILAGTLTERALMNPPPPFGVGQKSIDPMKGGFVILIL